LADQHQALPPERGLRGTISALSRAILIYEEAGSEAHHARLTELRFRQASLLFRAGEHERVRLLLEEMVGLEEGRKGGRSLQVGLMLKKLGLMEYSLKEYAQAATHLARARQVLAWNGVPPDTLV
jgi:hypothetical protein